MNDADDLDILERDEDVVDEDTYDQPFADDIEDETETLSVPAPVKILKTSKPKKQIKVTKKQSNVKVKVQPKKVTKATKVGKKQAVRHKKMKVESKKLKKKLEKKSPVKHKKNGKRGPKGPQSSSWTMPYQPSSTLHKAFELCTKKGGIKLKELIKAVKKFGGNPSWVITQLKLGHSLGWVWECDDSNDRLRVLHWKNMTKKLKKR